MAQLSYNVIMQKLQTVEGRRELIDSCRDIKDIRQRDHDLRSENGERVIVFIGICSIVVNRFCDDGLIRVTYYNYSGDNSGELITGRWRND